MKSTSSNLNQSWAYLVICFLGSFLLFQTEILIGKRILPLYGGSYQVWTTSMMFFQGMLFFGYLYAHFVLRKVKLRTYAAVHLILLLLAAATCQFSITTSPSAYHPAVKVLESLLISIGAAFLILSTTSIVIQKWFAQSNLKDKNNPYFLFSASNAGALCFLALYPFVMDPFLSLNQQIMIWRILFVIFIAAHLLCWPNRDKKADKTAETKHRVSSPAWIYLAYWTLLTMGASSLLLAVTNFITMDIASVPLLWIIPLAIYLVTFIINFKKKPWYPKFLNHILLISIAALLIYFMRFPNQSASILGIVFHCLILFWGGMICHRNLYDSKPTTTAHLTQFYLCIGLGGWLGGILVSIVIPIIGRKLAITTLDYIVSSIVIFAALIIRDSDEIKSFIKKHKKIASVIALSLVVLGPIGLKARLDYEMQHVIFALRNFYGLYRVHDIGGIRYLMHESTIHGMQFLDSEKSKEPISYFHKESPVAGFFSEPEKIRHVGIIGLGVGTLSYYSQKGQTWDFYELDPDVLDIAQRYFTYLRNSPVQCNIIIGDGRLNLKQADDRFYDLFIIDAFSSDSIPLHLITREAVALYLSKLSSRGYLVFHISNRYLNLVPILTSIAESLDVPYTYQNKLVTQLKKGVAASKWFVMSPSPEAIDELITKHKWADQEKLKKIRKVRCWTDDYINIFDAFAK